jgi:hypothetical protein
MGITMPCRHHTRNQREIVTAIPGYTMVRLYCSKCRGYISMGPSDDTLLERINRIVELRAAELAERRRGTPAEQEGWEAHRLGGNPIGYRQWCGWLAREITFCDADDGAARLA